MYVNIFRKLDAVLLLIKQIHFSDTFSKLGANYNSIKYHLFSLLSSKLKFGKRDGDLA